MFASLASRQTSNYGFSPPSLCTTSTGLVFCSKTADTGTKGDSMKNVIDETEILEKKIKKVNITNQLVDGHPYARSAIMKHTLVQQETVKHVVQQNCRSSSLPGIHEKAEKKEEKGPIQNEALLTTVKRKGLLEASGRKLVPK